jgi:hypothetical protein
MHAIDLPRKAIVDFLKIFVQLVSLEKFKLLLDKIFLALCYDLRMMIVIRIIGSKCRLWDKFREKQSVNFQTFLPSFFDIKNITLLRRPAELANVS